MNKALSQKKLTGCILLAGSSEKYPEIAYASGFHCPDEIVFLKKRTVKYLVVSPLEYERARQQTRDIRIMTPAMLTKDSNSTDKGISGWIDGIMKFAEVSAATVPFHFPLGMAERLRQAGYSIEVCEDPIFPEREVKKYWELQDIKHAQSAAVKAMKKAAESIAETSILSDGRLSDNHGILTSERLRRIMNHVLLDHDCFSTETIAASGSQSACPHEKGHGNILAGTPIVIDIFPESSRLGYRGDLTRTFFKGPPDKKLRRIHAIVKEAQRAALNRVRAGVNTRHVHQAACRVFLEKGLETGINDNGMPYGFIHSTGHGVGLEIHEAPRIGNQNKRLRRGHVITVEPGYYLPGLGGIRIEDTIVVTKEGFEWLRPCRISPWIK